MSTINAQTIINEVMAAHAIAPSEYTWGDFITFKTSARGTHRVLNCKENLQRFADLIRKNAAAFGGGLIREEKQKPAVSYPSKSISLYKQLIEDKDWYAALQLAEEKLAPLFFLDHKGNAHMVVAPIPLADEPRLVSAMYESGKFGVMEPRTMCAIRGDSYRESRSRNAQIENVLTRYNRLNSEQKDATFAHAATKPECDQAAARAQWMLEHGIVDDAAIEARIEAQASQDVAEVVAQAVAVSAIAEAMAPAAEEAQELVTCEAGESEAQESSTGNASVFTVAAYNTVTATLAGGAPTCTPTPAVSGEPPAPRPVESAQTTAPSPETVPEVEIEATTPAAESQPEPVAPVVEISAESLINAGYHPTVADVISRNGIAAFGPMAQAEIVAKLEAVKQAEPAQTPDDYAKFNIRAKSGAWVARLCMYGTVYALTFTAKGVSTIREVFTTHQDRMAFLEMLANGINGGTTIEPVDAPTEAPTPPVEECTPDTPPMESRAKPEHDLKVGDVVRSSWGYDQTNVNHYQITKLIGKRTVEVRELAEHEESTGDMSGRVAPVWGEFVGEPMRRTVDRHGHVNILREKFGRASKIEPVAVVHGVRCYASTGYSSYA